MAKDQYAIVFLICSFAINVLSTEEELLYSRTLDHDLLGQKKKQKLSHFRFYWHDIISGKNPSAVQVIPPMNTSKTTFGATLMIDNPLTEGPNLSSRLLGRAQGFYAWTSQEEVSALMAMNFVFVQGKYNGSTITIFGRNPVLATARELPVIGGSGLFRFAGGYVKLKTYNFESASGNAIVEYNVFVVHY